MIPVKNKGADQQQGRIGQVMLSPHYFQKFQHFVVTKCTAGVKSGPGHLGTQPRRFEFLKSDVDSESDRRFRKKRRFRAPRPRLNSAAVKEPDGVDGVTSCASRRSLSARRSASRVLSSIRREDAADPGYCNSRSNTSLSVRDALCAESSCSFSSPTSTTSPRFYTLRNVNCYVYVCRGTQVYCLLRKFPT